jgi:hypothetical protein
MTVVVSTSSKCLQRIHPTTPSECLQRIHPTKPSRYSYPRVSLLLPQSVVTLIPECRYSYPRVSFLSWYQKRNTSRCW